MRSRRTPTARSTSRSRMAATARSSSAPRLNPPLAMLATPLSGGQLQLPVLAHGARPERAVGFGAQFLEARLAVNGARRGEMRVRPEHHLAVTLLAREGDALVHQPPAEARAP